MAFSHVSILHFKATFDTEVLLVFALEETSHYISKFPRPRNARGYMFKGILIWLPMKKFERP